MAHDRGKASEGRSPGKFLGSLREALAAAARADTAPPPIADPVRLEAIVTPPPMLAHEAMPLSAAEAARAARGGAPANPAILAEEIEVDPTPTTRVMRPAAPSAAHARTQIVRGKSKVVRGDFLQDPVVGWLVVVGGPGLGAFRPIFEGNNSVGRSITQRVPIDFGDETISSEEQAFIRYDSSERTFLLVPNLSKTNVVSINDKRPTSAVGLSAMDVITMGRTQLVFVPFCGAEFDWSELPDAKT